MVADEFNADEDMKDAFAQSIIDSSDGVFDDVVDVEAVVRRRRLQAEYHPPSPALTRDADRTRRLQTEYPPSPAPTREADRTLAPTRAAAGLADVSYTGVARVDGTEDAEAVSTDLLEKAAAALTTAVDDGSFLTKLRTNAAERSPEAAAAFNAVTVDETATRAHIGRARHVFVVTTPEPTAAPTPRPLSPPTPKPTPAPTPRPSLTMSPVSLVSGGGSGSGSGAAGPDAAAMGGGAAAGALVLLLLTAGAFVFYRRTVARDAKANAGPGVVDEAGGLEAPTQTALITSKVDEPPPPPAPGLLARALSRRGSDAAAAAPPPAPAAALTTTVRGKKKRGPVKGATAKADSKIRMVFAPMAAWYHDPARGALRQRHGAFPPTPDALANWKSFGAVTTAFLDDQGVASTGAPAASAAEPPAAAPPAAAPVTAPSAPPAPEARGWFGWGAGGDPASPSPPLEGVLVTPPTAVPVTASVVASSAPRNFCPTCGNRLADGANFCMACGRSVSS